MALVHECGTASACIHTTHCTYGITRNPVGCLRVYVSARHYVSLISNCKRLLCNARLGIGTQRTGVFRRTAPLSITTFANHSLAQMTTLAIQIFNEPINTFSHRYVLYSKFGFHSENNQWFFKNLGIEVNTHGGLVFVFQINNLLDLKTE